MNDGGTLDAWTRAWATEDFAPARTVMGRMAVPTLERPVRVPVAGTTTRTAHPRVGFARRCWGAVRRP